MSGFIDQYMGTFREKVGNSKAYRGEWDDKKAHLLGEAEKAHAENEAKEEAQNEPSASVTKKYVKPWSPHGYLGLQTGDHLYYTIFCLVTTAIAYLAICMPETFGWNYRTPQPFPIAHSVAFLVAYGPCVCAYVLCKATDDPMSWRWPFQHENILGGFGVLFALGWLSCIVPVYWAVFHVVELGFDGVMVVI